MNTPNLIPRSGKPQFSEAERAGLNAFLLSYDAHYDAIIDWSERYAEAIPAFSHILRNMPAAARLTQNNKSRALMRAAIVDGAWDHLVSYLHVQGETYAKLGVAFRDWFDLVGGMRTEMVPYIQADHRNKSDQVIPAILGMDLYLDFAMSEIGETYITTKEALIGEQQNAIREMSTPVLKLRDRLLLLPIVGLVDTYRARLVTETLLLAIREHRARVVVIDITGVAAVDTKVANHLFQTVAAARLMGARCVITGISSEIAQSIVLLGIDLAGLTTISDLQSGIEEADRIMADFEIDPVRSARN